jgi:hypothetical protein
MLAQDVHPLPATLRTELASQLTLTLPSSGGLSEASNVRDIKGV